MLALPVVLTSQSPPKQAPAPFSVFPVRPRWSTTIEPGLDGRPAFDGARAFVPIAGGRLAAFDLLQGKELWNVDQPAPVAMVAADGRVVSVAADTLTARAIDSGRVLWTLPLEVPLTAPPLAVSGWLVLGTSQAIMAVRAEDGTVLWTQAAGGTIVQAPALSGERVYVALQDGRLLSLRIQDGTRVWERRLGGAPQPMLVTGDRLYVGAADNYFYCVRTVDGEILWRWRTGADIVGAAVHDGGRVYFASMDNVLRALDAGSGAQRWKTPLPLRPTNGPIRVDDVILLTGLGTSVLGFQLKDGAAAGEFDAGGLLAAPPHPVSAPTLPAPLLVSVTRSVASGSRIVAVTRDFEPPARPLAPLPNEAPIEPPPEGATSATPTADGAPPPAPTTSPAPTKGI